MSSYKIYRSVYAVPSVLSDDHLQMLFQHWQKRLSRFAECINEFADEYNAIEVFEHVFAPSAEYSKKAGKVVTFQLVRESASGKRTIIESAAPNLV